jgi:leucyl aminopeptidase
MKAQNNKNKYVSNVDTNKYFHLDDVMKYSISDKGIKEKLNTLCLVINAIYFKAKITTSKLLIKHIENTLKLYHNKNIVSSGLEKLLTKLWKDVKDGKVSESVLTLELFVGSNDEKEIKTIVITIVNDNIEKGENNTYLMNENMRDCGSHIRHSLQKNNLGACNLVFLGLVDDDIVNLMEGFVLSMYQFKKYKTGLDKKSIKTHPYSQLVNREKKTQKSSKSRKSLKGGNNQKRSKKHNSEKEKDDKKDMTKRTKQQTNNIYILHICLMNSGCKKIQKMIEEMLVITRNIHMCQDLLNEPGNKINPVSLVEFIKYYINLHKLPLKMKVINEDKLKKMGMNLLVSVGQGSLPDMRSRLVVLEYNGSRHNSKSKGKNNKEQMDCVLIGKGVTQDTGGISIKPGISIPEMKTDKAGTCVVFALMCALSKLGSKKNIVGLLPIAENSIGSEATIPGDIVKAYNGMNVEIVDTDGEGRLMMADCLSYAQDKWSGAMYVDVSTLTMELENMSCKEFSSVIGLNTDKEINNMIKNGEEIGERLVKFPFLRGKVEEELKSDVADIRNVVKKCKGQIYPSTTFLAHFVKEGTKWIHLDLGGNTYKLERGYSYLEEETVGVGIKLLAGLF